MSATFEREREEECISSGERSTVFHESCAN